MNALQKLQAYFQMGYAPQTMPSHTHALHQDKDGVIGHFAGLELHSHFQPLFQGQHMQAYAYEALLRPRLPGHSTFQAPHTAFELADTAQTAIYLDRLCRVVHAMNFVRQQPQTQRLFLNVSTRHIKAISHSHGEAFESLLQVCGLQPQQVVLEILEADVDSLDLLQKAVANWRAHGFQIALDDFGCQNSNFDRLWQLTPDIVKLDRELVVQAEHNKRAAIILPKLIEMIHDLGASVVCEGIETATQHQLCMDAGADLLQGYFYARPAAHLQTAAAMQA